MRPTLQLLTCFCIAFNFAFVVGQDIGVPFNIDSKKYSVYNWTTEQGIPQNTILSIQEDKNGMVWLATFNGLCRFDGNQFRVYNDHNEPAITSSIIVSLITDHKGDVWFTTHKELVLVKDNKFTRFELPYLGEFEIIEAEKELFLWSPKGIFSVEQKMKPVLDRTDKSLLRRAFVMNNEVHYILNSKVHRLKDKQPISENKYQYIGKNFFRLFKTNEIHHYSNAGLSKFEHQNLPSDAEYISELKNHKLYVQTIDSVFVLDEYGKVSFRASLLELNAAKIPRAFESLNGIIWLGASNNGVYMLFPKRFSSISANEAKTLGTGSFIYEAEDGSIWMDGVCGELLQTKDYGKSIVKQQNLRCNWGLLLEDQTLWTIAINQGVFKNDSIHALPTADGQSHGNTFAIYKSQADQIFIGTSKGVYQVKNDVLHRINGSEAFGEVYCFYEDRSRKLWFCGSKGVGQLKGNIALRSIDLGGTYNVRSIYQDEEMNYWIGTSNDGLILYRGGEYTVIRTSNNTLPHDIWCILEDKMGYFWFNSDNGIYRISRRDILDYVDGKTKNIYSIRFGHQDGIINPEGNSRTQNKALIDQKGMFWFSTVGGPVWINPNSINIKRFIHPILIDEVRIDGTLVNTNNIVLSPENEHIQLNFSQANFLDTKHLGYEYQINKLSRKWVNIGSNRSINFSELPHGEYQLKIRQVGTNTMVIIPFTVEVYFYQTQPFLISLWVAGTTLFFFFLFWIWRKRRRGIQEIKKLDHMLKELRINALQLQMNPHFVFNCLNSIQSLYIIGENDKANQYMSNFSALLRTVLNHADNRWISLQEEIDMYHTYIPLEGLQLNDSFTYEIIVDPSVNPSIIKIPSMISQTFVENAIKHGLKPLSERKGRLIIRIFQDDSHVIMSIEDNGVGVMASRAMKKTLNIKHKSKGNKITYERIELMNALEDMQIRVKTEPLEMGDDGPIGTIVQLFFPKKKP